MRYIGNEISFLDKKHEISTSFESERFINDAIIEIYGRIRVLLTQNLNEFEIHYIKNTLDLQLGYTEQDALKRIENFNRLENGYYLAKKELEKILGWLRRFTSKYKINLDIIFFSTVSILAEISKQPSCGYIPIKKFRKKQFQDGKKLYINENIPKSIIGLCVDYLIRYMSDKNKEKAFEISLLGLSEMSKNMREKIGFFESADDVLADINGLDDTSIKRACLLCCFDEYYRAGASFYKDFDISSVNPDTKTIENIRIMVERGLAFFESYGEITEYGFTFDGGYTMKIRNGDGDFLTKDTLWDLKVSQKNINSIWTLQLIIYWIMGQHSQKKCFNGIDKIGIFNPRQNISYVMNTADIPMDVIKDIEDDVIGYDRTIASDEDSIKLSRIRADKLKTRINLLLADRQIDRDKRTFEEKGRQILKHFREKN